jgi:hypothetical protein
MTQLGSSLRVVYNSKPVQDFFSLALSVSLTK